MVLHFVEDVASSYIVQKMKRPPKINPLVGGHTTLRGSVVCSEFYKTVTIRGKTQTLSGVNYAKLASTRACTMATLCLPKTTSRGTAASRRVR
jgi:hypothetical protein